MIIVENWGINYETIADSLRRNGDRHAARAAVHIAAGKPEWAANSMRKAERNWARAKKSEAEIPEWAEHQANILAQRVAEQLLYGF